MRYNINKDSCRLVITISVAIGNKKLPLSLSELQMGQIKAKTCCHYLYICRQNDCICEYNLGNNETVIYCLILFLC